MAIPGNSTTRVLTERITQGFPHVKPSRAKRILTGWDNIVLDIDGRFIFRFPRFKTAEESLWREVKLVRKLSGRLSVQVPDYEYVLPPLHGNEYGFAGYRKIAGTPLTTRGFQTEWTVPLARGLARFLRSLHTLSTSQMSGIVPAENSGKAGSRLESHHLELRARGYEYMDEETRLKSEKFFEECTRVLNETVFSPVLIHGDLTSRNILLDPRSGRLTGILDWGDSRIGDPALDFAGLFEVNRKLAHETLREYGELSREFLSRVEIYWRMLPFFEVLYGLYSGSDRIRRMGVRDVRARLREPPLSRSYGP